MVVSPVHVARRLPTPVPTTNIGEVPTLFAISACIPTPKLPPNTQALCARRQIFLMRVLTRTSFSSLFKRHVAIVGLRAPLPSLGCCQSHRGEARVLTSSPSPWRASELVSIDSLAQAVCCSVR